MPSRSTHPSPPLLSLLVGLCLACGTGSVSDKSQTQTERLGSTPSLVLKQSQYAPGSVVTGTATFTNFGSTAVTFSQLVITSRPPGGTHANGPYDNFSPALGFTTVQPGQTLTLTASRTLQSGDPNGTWDGYATYQDSTGWHDGPDVSFTVSAPSTSGGLSVAKPVSLSRTSYAVGDTVTGTVTYQNNGSAPVSIQRLVIATRPPGSTHAGGPYDDLSPSLSATTLQPGQSITLTASRALTSPAPEGTWDAYSTYQDASGWHDGPDVYFQVGGSAPPPPPPPSAGGYSVRGNTIYDANGQPHLFRGVARPSLEWSPTGDHLSLADYQLMKSWNANVVRIPMNQDFWLAGAAQHSSTYAATIQQQVAWAEQAGLDVILDLHWSDQGNLGLSKSDQQVMADANSVQFWREVASTFKGDTRVLFELYNEPHDVSWAVWRNGGSANGFAVHGMQELYDAVRGTGANNLVLIGGLNWAYDLSGVPANAVSGNNIVYVTHPYNYSGKQPGDWDAGFGFLTATYPVIATEFGTYDCSTGYYSSLVSYAKSHNMSWTAWAWYPGGCGFPSVIADWSGTPTAPGQVVKSALLSP